jgi:hypothetical protein
MILEGDTGVFSINIMFWGTSSCKYHVQINDQLLYNLNKDLMNPKKQSNKYNYNYNIIVFKKFFFDIPSTAICPLVGLRSTEAKSHFLWRRPKRNLTDAQPTNTFSLKLNTPHKPWFGRGFTIW